MRPFQCSCADKNVLFFDNDFCHACQCPVGLDFARLRFLVGREEPEQGLKYQDSEGQSYRLCANGQSFRACNWLIPEQEDNDLCLSCRMTASRPAPEDETLFNLWRIAEDAKRRTLYTLVRLGLPLTSASGGSLTFHFEADAHAEGHFREPIAGEEKVFTGHADGLITLNLAEVDDVARHRTRIAMGERYRTVLGTLRHETGHYYWNVLVAAKPVVLDACRALFGDDTLDYAKALEAHYARDPLSLDWQEQFVSFYAGSHPWEDWAESWAHVMHILDTMETAYMSGLTLHPKPPLYGDLDLAGCTDFDSLYEQWCRFSVVHNQLNRSMGLPDAYPFVLNSVVQEKLRFIFDLLQPDLFTPPEKWSREWVLTRLGLR